MTNSIVLYYSGYGHTQKQAEAVLRGLNSVSNHTSHLIKIDTEGNISESEWVALKDADGIIFGCPTYMGAAPWQFKKIMEASSKFWMTQEWKDKIAGGFTNSASINGDKGHTIHEMMTFSMQHSMIWVGTGLMPSNLKVSTRNDVNWLGGFGGALAQSPADSSPDEGPFPGDLETARLFGMRIAETINRFKS